MFKTTRPWHWVDTVFFGIRTLYLCVSIILLYTAPEMKDASFLFMTILFFLSFVGPLLFWRPRYINPVLYPVAEMIFSGTLAIYLVFLTNESQGYMQVAALTLGYLTNRKNWWWTPIFLLFFPIFEAYISEGTLTQMLLQFISTSIIYSIGLSFNYIVKSSFKMKKLLKQNEEQFMLIEEQNKALIQYSEQVEKLTLLEERNRMARELHDTVGHTFTSVIMGMDAVLYLIDKSPEKAKAKLEVLRSVTRNGLDEVRKNIHEIASDDDDSQLSIQLSRLAKEFSIHTATKMQFQLLGNEIELSKHEKLTFIRCLQESLTNAKRHGRATSIEVTLTYDVNAMTLLIEDDGIGSDKLQLGFGLQAMKERLQALQGDLLLRSNTGEGVRVLCSIPLRRGEHEGNKAAIG